MALLPETNNQAYFFQCWSMTWISQKNRAWKWLQRIFRILNSWYRYQVRLGPIRIYQPIKVLEFFWFLPKIQIILRIKFPVVHQLHLLSLHHQTIVRAFAYCTGFCLLVAICVLLLIIGPRSSRLSLIGERSLVASCLLVRLDFAHSFDWWDLNWSTNSWLKSIKCSCNA